MAQLQGIFELFPDIGIDNELRSYFKDSAISNINIYNKEKKIEIVLDSAFLIPREAVFKVSEKIQKKYKLDTLKIKVKYTKIEGTPEEILFTYWASAVAHLKSTIPISKAILHGAQWSVDGNKLNVNLKTCGAELLDSKGCCREIENLLSDELGINLKVVLHNPKLTKEEQDHYDTLKGNTELKVMKETLSKPSEVIVQKSEVQETTPLQNIGPIDLIHGKHIKSGEITGIFGLNDDSRKVIVEGDIIKVESREITSGKFLISFDITDYKGSITAKIFIKPQVFEKINENLKVGIRVRVQGDVVFDKYVREVIIMATNIVKLEKKVRKDKADQKRSELHLHTKMSAMDGLSSVKDIVKRAASWGHKAIAITDHGVVQAFPDAFDAGESHGIKIIYGVECYLVDDKAPIVANTSDESLDDTFVVFDIETTGLHAERDKITEIGAVKVSKGEIIDSFNTFVNPGIPIPHKITELTGITDQMVEDAQSIEEILPKFLEFVGDATFVAHNASFDMGFIRYNARNQEINILNPVVDTLELSRLLLTNLKKHKLNIVCEHLGVTLENHHRAVDDAKATAYVFIKFIDILKDKGIDSLQDINKKLGDSKKLSNMGSYHAIILVKDYKGLRNLYELISISHLKHFYKKPRIPKTLLLEHKEGLIIGSACEAGELYSAILNHKGDEEIEKIAEFYDYLEIQPISNNMFLVENQKVKSVEDLKAINKKIVDLGEKLKKLVVATCDVHYLDPVDDIFRRILLKGQGFEDGDKESFLYLRTTDEMLREFAYLGDEKCFEVVVTNPNNIADQIEEIIPIPKETFPPKIDGAEEELQRLTLDKAKEIYGDPIPQIVQERIDKELNSIIKNGFAVMYIIAQKLVWKSLNDGYLVGSRGSVGSSLVANLSGITEVNALPPHYVCPNCRHSEFIVDGSVGSGFDLPDKVCPKCETEMMGNGHDIPFETFLGFDGDKEPDIDLNFSGEYQPVAHKYTEELFGEGYVFRAGTIGTIAEKTAYGFVKKYLEGKGVTTNNAEINRLVMGCTGVKRTTGQHPGGVMILPKGHSIYEFCPIQRPADDTGSNTITTHFDYHSISGRLLKLDILGHDDPTAIRMLEDLTGIDAKKIKIGEKNVMKLFTTPEPMGIKPEDINSEVGSFAIPEFGTKFVRQMLVDTKPTTISELVRISGLSHGTDVWLNNAQELVRNGVTTLSEVISTRDDIMVYLIYRGLPPKSAFKIMEGVRKGKGLNDENEALMREHNVPEWYIDSCKKIKYMFPKAHAAAYVMMGFRIAYFKLYYPEAFYATYFTVRADEFDAGIMTHGAEKVQVAIKEIEQNGNNATQKEKNMLTILEVANEMYCRGLKFVPIDIYKSDAKRFVITPEGLLPPLNALQGLGVTAAENIIKAREGGEFMSKEDLRIRAKISKTVIEIMGQNGCLELPDSNQISFFG
ncbi:MAG TPA: PolC-type DNA polymerase III [Lachnospiraceae bacterium]|nr:PolC-type DNA polymerase III [Lachnospiraceae bacterium]